MLQREFDERMGYQSTEQEYIDANAVYESTSLDKDDFCRDYKTMKDKALFHDMAILMSQMRKKIQFQKETIKDANTKAEKAKMKIARELLDVYMDTGSEKLRDAILHMITTKEYILMVIESGYSIQDNDRKLMAEFISNIIS